MSGPKAYTMKEMKGIVEYLVEHKAYGEIRGRKMWVDYANSSLTTRTWQSLKETFLKRILPDIQNPYYQLTRDQVCSFKQGVDVQAKEKNNRLEIRTVSEESTNNEKAPNIEQPSTSAEMHNEAEKTLGEEIKSATITVRNRSSADTFIIEDDESRQSRDDPPVSKKTTEELLEELGEPSKSLKECLDFESSEPPCIVQKVLEDFETESEGSDKELQMQIVEDIPENNLADVNQEVFVIEDSENLDNVEFIEDERIVVEGGVEVDIGPTFDHEIVTEVTTTDLQGLNNWLEGCAQAEQEVPARNESDASVVQETAEQNEDADKNKPREEPEPMTIEAPENITEKPKENKKPIDSDNNNQSSLNATSDTIIPNNQEVLDATKSQKTNSKFDILAPLKDASRKRSTSTDTTVTKKQKLDDRVETKTNGDVIDVTPSTNNTEAIFEALKKSDKIDVTQAQHIDELAHNKNPCLKSVSLFEEQFNTTKYSDSEEDTPMPINKEKTIENTVSVSAEDKLSSMKDAPPSDKIVVITDLLVEEKQKETIETEPPAPTKQKIPKSDPPIEKKHDKIDRSTEMHFPDLEKQDFIVLMSNSDSDVQQTPPSERPKERFKHLEQAFGFVPGTSKTAAQRRRSLRSRNRTKSQRTSCTINEDSDWEGSISEPELADDFISPPRGRRHRNARKYRNPKSGRLVALGEEGALFLLNGNRIVPIVKNGKPLTYVTYDSLAASEEEEELMWKQKYIDEKKKAVALKRQLEEFQKAGNSRSKSPIFPNPPRNVQSTNSVNQTVQKLAETDMNKQMDIKHAPGGKIQIILSKNNEESVNLQGHWPEVLPVVQNLMSIFYKTDDTSTATKPTEPTKEDISGLVTPIIQILDKNERKVDDLESEIFKEIEEHAKTDETQTSNVTKRKVGRPKKTPSISSEHSEKSETTAKRPRRSKLSLKDKTGNTENIKIADETKTNTSKANLTERLSVESVKPVNEKPAAEDKVKDKEVIEPAQDKVVNASVKIPVEPRVTRSRKSGNETDSSTRTVTTRLSARANDNEDDVRYMFPPGPKSRRNSKLTPNKRSSENPHETSQGDLRNSVDSTQGYQDSDASPAKVNTTKRKKKLSITVKKGKYVPRKKSLPTISIHDISLESSNSSYFVPKKSRSQSTLDSEIYKTESYQILMGNRKLSLKKLDVIDETSKSDDLRPFNTLSKESSSNSNMVLEVGSSSNISLPLSPELSVVENLSISREMIQSDNHPTINEIQANDSVVSKIYNQYLISDVDVTIPLMQQDCELLNTHDAAKSKVKKQKTPIKVSDLLRKVPVVNMSINNTLSDTLDRKLRDLLLESAKKISDSNKENMMDVDESNVVEPKKIKGKKRCSTPRKRASTKKNKPVIGPVIDEHVESCSRGGRMSCPPVITFIPLDENANNSADVQINDKPKPKKVKKDVIKVKIQRPKSTTIAKAAETAVGNTSQISVYTDSGINETASISEQFFQGDSVELIHNHSETCLQANECIGNSIEFVENSKSESVVSVSSTTSLECELLKVMEDVEILSEGYRRRNAQDASGEKSSGEIFGTPTETIYHSPIANCSLLTDDLSDEVPIPSTKWYLFSEDDTNNTNLRPEQMTSNTRVSNFAANLKQLFPITCAVPDLSTISELSKENEGSKKGFDTDGDTRSSDYQSLV